MCGIGGIWTSRAIGGDGLLATVDRMAGRLRHRGPDDSRTWRDPAGEVALGHTRLAIIDLSDAAGQPMLGPSGHTRIVFNGEIYNYVELRRTLAAEGVVFRTISDTEVVLALYEKHGLECVKLLRGMFAFGIWDARARRLVIARDRLGKKPLYYSCRPGHFVFASEIKALRVVVDDSQLEVDPGVLDQYLSCGFIGGPRTIYRGIAQLGPGAVLVASAPDVVTVREYWRPSWQAKRRVSFAETVREANRRITEAVALRLRADVPVGVLLSGGIDSGLVTAIASRLLGKSCPTFTVGFEDVDFDERPLAAAVARRYGTDHHEIQFRTDILDLLPRIARAYDQPFADPSAVPTYCVAQAVRSHGIKVVLNGDGGDELFGGYRRHLATAWLSRMVGTLGEDATARVSRMIVGLLPRARAHRSLHGFAYRFLRGAAAGEADRLLIWSSDGFTPEERISLRYRGDGAGSDGTPLGADLRDGGLGLLDRAIALDLHWMLPYGLLVKMDIATMAHGLEARSPFLDHELVEWAVPLPDRVRLPGLTTKPILRALARTYLPDEICRAPKRGFEIPLRRWLTSDLEEVRDDLILDRSGLVATMFDRSRLERFLRDGPTGDPDRWANLVWTLLILAAWDRFVARGEEAVVR